MNTGSSLPGRPSMGSWVTYGLGSESKNLPAFVVHVHRQRHQRRRGQLVERLSADHLTGVRLRNQGDPILDVSNPPGIDAALQRDSIDLVGRAQPAAARATSATRRSPPASPPTKWPTACKRAPPS